MSTDQETSYLAPPPAEGADPLEPLPTSSSHRSLERVFAQKFATLGMRKRPTWRSKFDKFRLHQGPRVLFLFFWMLLQSLIFAFSFLIYQRSHRYNHARGLLGCALGLSRGAAAVINIDCGLILFSVCRNLISVLRSTFLNNIVPFDKSIGFHKVIAWSIVFFSMVHTVAHYANYYHLEKASESGGKTAQQMAFLTGTGFTGHMLVLILFLMISSSVERVRRKAFETFWYAHHLFILFFITLMSHGAFCFIRADDPPYCKASSYKFVSASLFFYIVERVLREVRARKPTSIHKIVLHPSKVVEVQMQKRDFKCKAGQYVFLNCPDISLYEWHPFTITSAPEEDYVSVHIRIVGDWTTAFTKLLGCSFDDERQYWIEEMLCKSTETIAAVAGAATTGFSSSAHAFEWFQDLLIALEEQNLSEFLEIRSYLTGELDADELNTIVMEAKSAMSLQKSLKRRATRATSRPSSHRSHTMAEEGRHITTGNQTADTTDQAAKTAMGDDEEGDDDDIEDAEEDDRDAITGLRSPTYYGRPNFDKIFSELSAAHPPEHGQVGVFFCGPKRMGETLHRCARKYEFKFHKENF
ncbi:hypothetical protein DFQ27_000594 [Actinomortierella ambigua]|uniref:FAD-binding FR-type domain-containing protein n=1 Tax=Actinomortierella ambigua TaxID=1343610 RepID=A0A9P6QCF6_9FUNG|nr:hypothetical protein DFQ27_000594 [Actinomortierella ambigua]